MDYTSLEVKDEKFWEQIREEFPVTRNVAYFQSAGMSPLPERVYRSIVAAYQRLHLYGDRYFMDDVNQSDKLRAKLGEMINTKADNICFTPNTSIAFTMLASAIKHSGPVDFNFVSLADEFPSTNVPFEFQGIPLKYVKPENGVYSVESILEAIDDQTLGVVCSHVQYATGFRLDIEKLGKALLERGLLFIVNATQSFPIFDIDVQKMHIDAMAVSFHKWGLSGVAGSMLYTWEGFRKKYPIPMAGWLSVHPEGDDFIPVQKNQPWVQFEDASQYNFGTMNFQALAGLDVAMDFILEIGRYQIRKRIRDLTDYLIKRLEELPLTILSPIEKSEHRSSIVLVDVNGKDNKQAVEFLDQKDVLLTIRAGAIRISCNFFNNHHEIDRLAEALELYCQSTD